MSLTFNTTTLPVSLAGGADVVWVSYLSLFVAISVTAPAKIVTSPDGITWTARTNPNATDAFFAIAASGAKLVAVGTNVSLTSTDGITWTSHAHAFDFIGVAHNGTVFCGAVNGGNGAGGAATSTDGVTWTSRTLSTSSFAAYGIVAGAGMFVIRSQSTASCASSPDGTTWTEQTVYGSSLWVACTWGNGLFILSGDGFVGYNTSPDGITWTYQTTWPNNGEFRAVWNGTLWCAPSSAGIYTSTDGLAWTLDGATSVGGTLAANATTLVAVFGSGTAASYATAGAALFWQHTTLCAES